MKLIQFSCLLLTLFILACAGNTETETKQKESPKEETLPKYHLVLEKDGVRKTAGVTSEKSVNYGGNGETNEVRFKIQGSTLRIFEYYKEMNAGIEATLGKEYEAEMKLEGMISKGKAKLTKIYDGVETATNIGKNHDIEGEFVGDDGGVGKFHVSVFTKD